jgi:hypothetical protein
LIEKEIELFDANQLELAQSEFLQIVIGLHKAAIE